MAGCQGSKTGRWQTGADAVVVAAMVGKGGRLAKAALVAFQVGAGGREGGQVSNFRQSAVPWSGGQSSCSGAQW